MTDHELLQLYPPGTDQCPNQRQLCGLYLNDSADRFGKTARPFIYANYVSSMDGRIALRAREGKWKVPPQLKTVADWTLFKELQAQAECLVTHAGYLRALKCGDHGNVLQISSSIDDQYLGKWRQQAELPVQPKLIVVSRSLNFELPSVLDTSRQHVSVITGIHADFRKMAELEERGVFMHRTEQSGLISADQVYQVLKTLNVRNAYLQTGPHLLHSMLNCGLLDELYLTINLSLLGGEPFLTMVNGAEFSQAAKLQMQSLFLYRSKLTDAVHTAESASSNEEQLFASFRVGL